MITIGERPGGGRVDGARRGMTGGGVGRAGRVAGATGLAPGGGVALEALVHVDRTVTGGAHRDVRDPAAVAHDALHSVLVGGAGENERLSAPSGERAGPVVAEDELVGGHVAGVVPHLVRRGVLASRAEVKLRAAHAGDQCVAVAPGGDRLEVVSVPDDAHRCGATV